MNYRRLCGICNFPTYCFSRLIGRVYRLLHLFIIVKIVQETPQKNNLHYYVKFIGALKSAFEDFIRKFSRLLLPRLKKPNLLFPAWSIVFIRLASNDYAIFTCRDDKARVRRVNGDVLFIATVTHFS